MAINALNFQEEADSTDEINSPTSLKALNLLGYTMQDLKKKNKEQIQLELQKKLEEIPPHRVDQFIDLKIEHYEIRRMHRVEQLREKKSKLLFKYKNNTSLD